METALATLLSYQFIFFALFLSGITVGIRAFVEFLSGYIKISNLKLISFLKRLWNELLLPFLPPFLGFIVAIFASKFGYPDGIVSFSSRAIFGFCAGMLSSLVWRAVKSYIKSRINDGYADSK